MRSENQDTLTLKVHALRAVVRHFSLVPRYLWSYRKRSAVNSDYWERIMALPDMVAWRSAAMLEPEELEELDMEF